MKIKKVDDKPMVIHTKQVPLILMRPKDETISEAEYLSLKRDYVAKTEQLKKMCEETEALLSTLKPDVNFLLKSLII